MHYFGILAIILAVTFATGGHSQTFSKAAVAVGNGDVAVAIDLFSTAVRRTLHDADIEGQRKAAAVAETTGVSIAEAPPPKTVSITR